MAVLETIRVKFGVLITVLIAVALLSFIIDPTTLQNVASSMSSKYDVGEIDGKSISYTDYSSVSRQIQSRLSPMSGMRPGRNFSTSIILFRMLRVQVSM